MSARLNPRLGLVLLVVLGLSAFLSLQPSPDDELAVPGRPGATPPHGARDDGAATAQAEPRIRHPGAPAGRGAAPAARAASLPTAAQARELATWAEAWAHRATRTWPDTATDARWAWAPQQPPPPPPPPLQEPPPPMAPRFPYAWVGRFVDEVPRAVIAGPQGTWVLRQGEVIEGQWRLGPIAERQLTVTYLPLSQDQTVALK